MFNSPRPSQRYVGTNSNGGFGGSFVDTNPLSNSVYDEGLDPWSSTPSPAPTPIPQAPASVFSAVIGDLFCRYQCLFETVMHRSGRNSSLYLSSSL
jgi:sorting nexin-8